MKSISLDISPAGQDSAIYMFLLSALANYIKLLSALDSKLHKIAISSR